MRLYVKCEHCNEKAYLAVTARSRYELMQKWGCDFNIRTHDNTNHVYKYNVYDVRAESSTVALPSGAIIGGVVGLLGGPLGVLLGGVIGGGLGYNSDMTDQEKASYFNRSQV